MSDPRISTCFGVKETIALRVLMLHVKNKQCMCTRAHGMGSENREMMHGLDV